MNVDEPKRVLLLGITGMLGTYLAKVLPAHFTIYSAIPRNHTTYVQLKNISWLTTRLDVSDVRIINKLLDECKPDVIVNCIAVTSNSQAASNAIESIKVNSLFPHLLAKSARSYGCQLIHFSTDGVFSGRQGCYSESDLPDPLDIYGRSKLLGEIVDENCLTLRTTFFGLSGKSIGLIDWLLTQKDGRVKGYKNYIFSGLSMAALSSAIITIIRKPTFPSGLYHLGGEPISKYDLLSMVSERFGLNIEIEPILLPVVNRSLNSSLAWKMIGQKIPQTTSMIDEMYSQFSRGYI